jgi:hypothetical protein
MNAAGCGASTLLLMSWQSLRPRLLGCCQPICSQLHNSERGCEWLATLTDDWFAPGHVAEARLLPIDGVGVELRYEWNGDSRSSEIFKTWKELEAAAEDKRRDLEASGWHSELQSEAAGTGRKLSTTFPSRCER